MRRSCCLRPLEFADRSILWNSVEQIEGKDSQLACKMTLARELSGRQQLALVRAYVKDNFVDKGNVEICGGRHGQPAPTGHWGRRSSALVDHRSYKRQGIDKIPLSIWNDCQ